MDAKKEGGVERYFHAEMTVGEAMALHPHAAHVFASFHLGGCSHCEISAHETIAQVCEGYGVPVDVLLEALNALLEPEQDEPLSAVQSAWQGTQASQPDS